MRIRRRRGFTAVELLVVVAVITLLVALLLPAVQQAREAARRAQCKSNLKQLGLAMHNYHDVYGQLPLGAVWKVDAPARTIEYGQSWGQALLPLIDQGALATSFDVSQPIWSGATNLALIATPLPVFNCPSNSTGIIRSTTTWSSATIGAGGRLSCEISPATPITANWANSDYIINSDVRSPLYSNLTSVGVTTQSRHCMFYMGDTNATAVVAGTGTPSSGIDGRPNFTKVTDGLSNTIMISELAARNQLWEMRKNVTSPPANEPLSAQANFFRLLNQQTHFGGGGWADPMNCQWVNGGNRDGHNAIRISNGDRNSCVINCTNLSFRGFYSFHPGLAMFAMGDGAVKDISEYIDDYVLAFLLTRAGGEVIGEY